jgi:hypothetical protein
MTLKAREMQRDEPTAGLKTRSGEPDTSSVIVFARPKYVTRVDRRSVKCSDEIEEKLTDRRLKAPFVAG